MYNNYLFPNRFKRIGWVLFTLGCILIFIYLYLLFNDNFFDFLRINVFSIAEQSAFWGEVSYFTIREEELILEEVFLLLLLIGAVFIIFSKEKKEDEYISMIRLESLVWALYFNLSIFVLAIIFTFGGTFGMVLVFNTITILIVYLIRFNWLIHRFKKSS